MSDQDLGANEAPSSYLNMSDEDIMNMAFPTEDESLEATPAEDVPPEVDSEDPTADNVEEEFEQPQEDEEDLPVDEDEQDDEPLPSVEEDTLDSDDDEDDTEGEEEEAPQPEGDLDYKSKYEELLAPFKANGKTIKVDTADDLRRLAQMGVGFNSKMAALKPVRKIAKMLENEGLLDESKISFLIDLSKNNPDAINKLVSESGINPLDINTESTEGYKPQTYTVDDGQLDLDEALTDLKQSPTYSKTVDVVSNKWDEASRRVLVGNPQLIRDMDAHMQDGTYDTIMEVVDRERMLNRIPAGVSDLDAYNHVGNQLHAAQQQAAPVPSKPDAPKPKDTKRNSRRRAAGTTRSKPATQANQPDSFLKMSDEEFDKLMPKYM